MEISKNTFQNKFQFNFGVRVGDLKKIFFVFQSLKFKEKYFLSKKLSVNFSIVSQFQNIFVIRQIWRMDGEPHINAWRQGWWMLGIMTTISHHRHRQPHGAGQESKYHHH